MKTERALLILINLLLLGIALFYLNGCMTYQKALKKYGHLSDSTRVVVRDTFTLRHDSVVLALKTDTTRLYQTMQQGRARIIYDRTHTITTVKADCLPDTVVRIRVVKAPPTATFGVNPLYKKATWGLLAIVLIGAILYVFLYHLQLSITKR